MNESGCNDSKSKTLAECVFDTVREPMIILDHNLTVLQASFSFYRHFQVFAHETVGRRVYDLGNCQWNIPDLRKLLEEVLPHDHSFDGYEVRHNFESIGPRILLLNARMIDSLDLILLAMEDITDRTKAEEGMRHSEERFRRLFETSKDGILMLDADNGVIIDANPFVQEIVDFSRSELEKVHIWELGTFRNIAASRSAFAEMQAAGYVRFEDLPLVRRDGEEITYNLVRMANLGLGAT